MCACFCFFTVVHRPSEGHELKIYARSRLDRDVETGGFDLAAFSTSDNTPPPPVPTPFDAVPARKCFIIPLAFMRINNKRTMRHILS